jgi:ribonuclease BN (tRNA processing enzyme)
MELVALGTAGSFARHGQACSGYLFRAGGRSVLVDLGSGALANLFRHMDPRDLDAVVLTHLHADHVADLFPLRLYLRYGERPRPAPLPVFAPPGARDALESFGPWAEPGDLAEVFAFSDLPAPLTVGPMSFTFVRTRHLVPTFGLVCRAEGRTLGLTSDTSWDPELPARFAGCDVLLADATYLGAQGIDQVHMCAAEAGRFAAWAGAGTLVLTHLWPEVDPAAALAEAAREFAGPISVLAAHDVVVP